MIKFVRAYARTNLISSPRPMCSGPMELGNMGVLLQAWDTHVVCITIQVSDVTSSYVKGCAQVIHGINFRDT